mmetsp:Transcript_71725/g.214125  ORF Transcript_71725/g.214125 Transcript_71725/m.214125 type:complete len:88 (-) Transcript_71725:1036-1299(-)
MTCPRKPCNLNGNVETWGNLSDKSQALLFPRDVEKTRTSPSDNAKMTRDDEKLGSMMRSKSGEFHPAQGGYCTSTCVVEKKPKEWEL